MRTVKYYLFVCLLLFSTHLYSQDKTCNFCKTPINEGEYVKAGAYFFHKDHFRCAQCDKVIEGNFYQAGDQFFHPRCYYDDSAEKCDHCGKPLKDEYIQYQNNSYHRECFAENIAERCDLCGKIINGMYYEDYWGNKYHKAHREESTECDYCGRLISEKISNGGFKYQDGRAICGVCKPKAVMDEDKAKSILLEVKQTLAQKGIVIDWNEIELNLVDKKVLADKARSHLTTKDLRGFANQTKTTRNGKIVDKEFHIYILFGMPEKTYRKVAAHELMHVWQYLETPEDIDPYLREGSCEYAAYLVASENEDKFSQYLVHSITTNKLEIYREGYERVSKLVEDKGITGWLGLLRIENDFPEEY